MKLHLDRKNALTSDDSVAGGSYHMTSLNYIPLHRDIQIAMHWSETSYPLVVQLNSTQSSVICMQLLPSQSMIYILTVQEYVCYVK